MNILWTFTKPLEKYNKLILTNKKKKKITAKEWVEKEIRRELEKDRRNNDLRER